MAASVGTYVVDVQANLPDSVLRLRALALAVESRGHTWTDDGVVETAERFRKFLAGDE